MTSIACRYHTALSLLLLSGAALYGALGTVHAAESARVFDTTRHALFGAVVATGPTKDGSAQERDGTSGPSDTVMHLTPGDALPDGSAAFLASPSIQTLPALAASSQVGATLRLSGPDNPAIDAEIQRLRDTATSAVDPPVERSRRIDAARSTVGRGMAVAARASWLMGLLTLHGIGVATDPASAAAWFERARLQGESMASAGLAWCDIDGCKAPANPAGARRWLPKLRSVNLPRAQYLQWLIESRLQPLQAQTRPQRSEPGLPDNLQLMSRQLLLSAAQRGDVQANVELGLESAGADQLAQALVFFRAAAPRSETAAANAQWVVQRLAAAPAENVTASSAAVSPGILTARGGATGGAASAINSTKPGANGVVISLGAVNTASELLNRAKRNHRGEGQTANFTEAIRLYRLAQIKGNTAASVEARKILELIFSRPAPGGQIDVVWMQQLANVEVSGQAVSLDGASVRSGLRRDPTPLFDLLPPRWRDEAVRGSPGAVIIQ